MSVTVQLIRNAFVWTSGFAVDSDGSPSCYAPEGLHGLDALANAGHPGNWWGLACDESGVPHVQGASDPCPGYYVSTTALVDSVLPVRDPQRYVDACTVPYVSIAHDLLGGARVHLGDVAMVCYGARRSGAVVADVSPAGHYGEGSMALADALGIPQSPRTGGCSRGVTWIVFRESRRGWPRAVAEFQVQAEELFAAWGGEAEIGRLVA